MTIYESLHAFVLDIFGTSYAQTDFGTWVTTLLATFLTIGVGVLVYKFIKGIICSIFKI